MNRKHIYYFLHGDKKSRVENNFMYLTVLDAVKEGKLFIDIGSALFNNKSFRQFHDIECQKGNAKYFYSLYSHGLSKKERYVLYFHQWYPALKNLSYFSWLKRNYDVKLVLIVQNPFLNKRYPVVNGSNIGIFKDIFDLILTDEKVDALNFGIRYQPDTFCIPQDIPYSAEVDLFFAGTDKNRSDMLYKIGKLSKQHGIRSDIRVIGNRIKNRYIDYSPELISYKDIIMRDLQTNCILEILQSAQKSYTTRYQEAVCLNKKLLTNNRNVINEKYYNPEYIRIFDDPETIDWNFVKERVQVDYKYDGDFSPVNFINKVDKELR